MKDKLELLEIAENDAYVKNCVVNQILYELRHELAPKIEKLAVEKYKSFNKIISGHCYKLEFIEMDYNDYPGSNSVDMRVWYSLNEKMNNKKQLVYEKEREIKLKERIGTYNIPETYYGNYSIPIWRYDRYSFNVKNYYHSNYINLNFD